MDPVAGPRGRFGAAPEAPAPMGRKTGSLDLGGVDRDEWIF